MLIFPCDRTKMKAYFIRKTAHSGHVKWMKVRLPHLKYRHAEEALTPTQINPLTAQYVKNICIRLTSCFHFGINRSNREIFMTELRH